MSRVHETYRVIPTSAPNDRRVTCRPIEQLMERGGMPPPKMLFEEPTTVLFPASTSVLPTAPASDIAIAGANTRANDRRVTCRPIEQLMERGGMLPTRMLFEEPTTVPFSTLTSVLPTAPASDFAIAVSNTRPNGSRVSCRPIEQLMERGGMPPPKTLFKEPTTVSFPAPASVLPTAPASEFAIAGTNNRKRKETRILSTSTPENSRRPKASPKPSIEKQNNKTNLKKSQLLPPYVPSPKRSRNQSPCWVESTQVADMSTTAPPPKLQPRDIQEKFEDLKRKEKLILSAFTPETSRLSQEPSKPLFEEQNNTTNLKVSQRLLPPDAYSPKGSRNQSPCRVENMQFMDMSTTAPLKLQYSLGCSAIQKKKQCPCQVESAQIVTKSTSTPCSELQQRVIQEKKRKEKFVILASTTETSRRSEEPPKPPFEEQNNLTKDSQCLLLPDVPSTKRSRKQSPCQVESTQVANMSTTAPPELLQRDIREKKRKKKLILSVFTPENSRPSPASRTPPSKEQNKPTKRKKSIHFLVPETLPPERLRKQTPSGEDSSLVPSTSTALYTHKQQLSEIQEKKRKKVISSASTQRSTRPSVPLTPPFERQNISTKLKKSVRFLPSDGPPPKHSRKRKKKVILSASMPKPSRCSPASPTPHFKRQTTPTRSISFGSEVETASMDGAVRSLNKKASPAPENTSKTKKRAYQHSTDGLTCESDPLRSNVEAGAEGWQQQLADDESDEEMMELEMGVEVDYTMFWPAIPLHDDIGAEEWVAHEDGEADKLLRDLLADKDHLTFNWTHDYNAFRGKREEFTGTPGPTFPVNDSTKPLDVFLKFFDQELFKILVDGTNKYASLLISQYKGIIPNSRMSSWKNTDPNEMAVFLSILIFQGLCPLSVEKDYWKENGYLTLKNFKNLMSFNRFVLIKRLLHFSTESAETENDQSKLRKIWPVLDHLNKKFSALYLPGQDIAIDESLLSWHGQLSFAQKIANKAAKVGIKSYELCESSTGYLWKFIIYTGKGHTVPTDQANDQTAVQIDSQTDQVKDRQTDEPLQSQTVQQSDKPTTTEASASSGQPAPSNATARIVCDLIKPLLNRGHTLVMDNFYNSPLLARYLKSQGTDCFGTLRINREYVPESIKSMTQKELRVDEIIQSYCHDLSILMWRHNKVVALISTFHKGEIGGRVKYGQYRYRPQVVLDYNKSMGGVDRKDQLLSSHPIERSRNQVWYKKLFRRLLNVTVLNSYIIFKSHHKNIIHREFRKQLAEALVQTFKPPEVERPFQVIVTSLLPISGPGSYRRPILLHNHFIGIGDSKRARCVWCRNSRTRYICKQCNVALCLDICFEDYHTRRDPPKGSKNNEHITDV